MFLGFLAEPIKVLDSQVLLDAQPPSPIHVYDSQDQMPEAAFTACNPLSNPHP